MAQIRVDHLVAFPMKLIDGKDLTTIPMFPLTVEGVVCLAVSGKALDAVCELLGTRIEYLSTKETELEGVILIAGIKKSATPPNNTQVPDTHDIRQQYINFCRGNTQQEVQRMQEQVERNISELKQKQAELVELINRQRETEIDLSIAESALKKLEESFMQDIQKIQKFSDVESVHSDGKKFSVDTKVLHLKHNEVEYTIGCFHIEIREDGLDGGVNIKNISTQVPSGWQHPAVTPNGMPLSGNILEVAPQLIGTRNFPVLISIIIQFLKYYSGDEDGERFVSALKEWPKISQRQGG